MRAVRSAQLSVNLNGGDLSGDGTVAANVNNIAGRVNPGGVGTAGTINIVAVPFGVTGNYTQGASGVLNIDIGGLTAGGEFDQLNVSGTASLDGTLNVGLINFAPAAGDSFRFLTFNSLSGNFATQNLPSLGGGLQFSVVVNPNDLTLSTISTSQGNVDVWTGGDAPSPIIGGGGGHSDNNWSDPLNWSNGVVPGPNDTAEFSGSANSPYGSYVDTAFTVGALVIDSSWGTSGGAISVNAPLTLNGLSDGNSGQWSSGNMITLNADLINKGTFTLTGSGTQGLFVGGVTAYSLVNQGSIIQADPSNLTLNGAAVLDNQGSYTFQGDGDITGVLSVVYASTVINSGTITKDAGTGNSVINVTTLNNSGTFDVATGTLTLQPSNGTFTGGASTDFDVADGAVLNLLNGGSATFTGSISGMPTGPLHTGTVQFGSGTLGIGSGGATFNFPTGMFQWSGGRIDVSAGSLTNANALTLTGSGTQDLFGSVYGNALINQGTIVQAGPSNLTLTGAAVLNNQGSYTFQDDGDITGVLYVVYGSTVINSGTITKAAGTGNSVINVTTFNNSGMFDVATGTLTLQPTSGTFAGGASPLFNVADGAVVNLLNGGSATFTGTISGVPTGPAQTGIVQFNNGTLATGNGGATFNFPTGMFQWGGGRIDVSARQPDQRRRADPHRQRHSGFVRHFERKCFDQPGYDGPGRP